MRTGGEIFVRRGRLAHSSGLPGVWHYFVTDPTEAGAEKMTACGIPVDRNPLVTPDWQFAEYEKIAAEFNGRDEPEGVRPCCANCLRVQRKEWDNEGF